MEGEAVLDAATAESASSPSKMGLTDSVIENTHTSTAFGKGRLSWVFLLSIRYHRVKN